MVQAAAAGELQTEMNTACICSTKSKIRDVVTRTATFLKEQKSAVVLGRDVTISKAISVCEIIKRDLGDAIE